MENLQKYLQMGIGIVVRNREQFDDLVAECGKLGYGWGFLPMYYAPYWEGVAVILQGRWLTCKRTNPLQPVLDWTSFKQYDSTLTFSY